MFKHIMLVVCMLAVAGCAAEIPVVTPAKPAFEPPKVQAPVETPKAEPVRPDIIVPQTTAVTGEQPKVQVPTILNFKRNVTFNHKLHSDTLVCTKCHKDGPGKIANFGKDFAHETCKGCHKENGQSISCSSCHRQ